MKELLGFCVLFSKLQIGACILNSLFKKYILNNSLLAMRFNVKLDG